MWYSLGLKKPPAILITRLVDMYVKVYENDGNFHSINTFVYITPHNEDITHALLAYLSSSWYALHLERNGSPMGGGALSLETYVFKDSFIPDFDGVDDDTLDKMSKAWLQYREDWERPKLDDVVFDMLGLTQDERSELYQELESCITIRRGTT